MSAFSFFRNIDFFGAPLFQKVHKNSSMYRSTLGGIISFIIVSCSIAYTVFVIYKWKTNQFTAKISSSVYASDYSLLDMSYDVIKLSFWKITVDSIDPFEEHILVPIITYTQNYTFTTTEILKPSNQTAFNGNKYIIPKMHLGFTEIDGAVMTTSEMFFQIVRCSPELLDDGQSCASQDTVDRFFSQSLNTLVMQVHYKQLDSKDGTLQSSVQEFLLQIEQANCYTLNTFLQTTLYEVRSSFLFGFPDYKEYINGALIQPQTNTVEYCKQAYGYDAYAVMYVIMKGNQTKTVFEYPSAGDLLANIGSIVSVLFMIRHLIIIMNSYFLNKQLIKQIISFYYPQFAQVQIYRNWKLRISKITYQNEILDQKEYQRFYDHLAQIISEKLTFQNMIYEMSRMYIILRSFKSLEEVKDSHYTGLSLNHLFLSQRIIEPCLKTLPSSARNCYICNFTEDDINILTTQQRDILMKQREQFLETPNLFQNSDP